MGSGFNRIPICFFRHGKALRKELSYGFISKIAQFINNDMNDNTHIVINDINLSTQMGGGREHFDNY